MITALNIAYEEKEKSAAFSRFYLLAVSMTLGAVLVALCAIAATAALAYLAASAAAGIAVAGHCRQGRGYLLLALVRGSDRLVALSLRSLARGREMEVDHAGLAIRRV